MTGLAQPSATRTPETSGTRTPDASSLSLTRTQRLEALVDALHATTVALGRGDFTAAQRHRDRVQQLRRTLRPAPATGPWWTTEAGSS